MQAAAVALIILAAQTQAALAALAVAALAAVSARVTCLRFLARLTPEAVAAA
jgi:hypothetical protein